MHKSKIEWCTVTWNPVTGCSKVSAGCKNCYAESIAKRFWNGRSFDRILYHENRILTPLEKWRKPEIVFVCSMSDLFHNKITRTVRVKIFEVMRKAKQHKFIVLTKRPLAMYSFYKLMYGDKRVENHIWLGVSVEDQRTAVERLNILSEINSNRLVSIEPLLEAIDLEGSIQNINNLHWIVVGGETGKRARPMNPNWVRTIKNQCEFYKIPFFLKSNGEWIFTADGVKRAGKKNAGRLLDDKLYENYPFKTNKYFKK